MTEQELKEADERLTVAKRMYANIQHVERHLETMGTLFSEAGDVDAAGFRSVVRGMEVIRNGAAVRIKVAVLLELERIVAELKAEFEKL